MQNLQGLAFLNFRYKQLNMPVFEKLAYYPIFKKNKWNLNINH